MCIQTYLGYATMGHVFFLGKSSYSMPPPQSAGGVLANKLKLSEGIFIETYGASIPEYHCYHCHG